MGNCNWGNCNSEANQEEGREMVDSKFFKDRKLILFPQTQTPHGPLMIKEMAFFRKAISIISDK